MTFGETTDVIVIGAGQADSQMLRDYCDGQAEFFSWLTKMEVVFSSVEHSAGQSVPRSHRTVSKQAVERLRTLPVASRSKPGAGPTVC